MNFVIKMFVKKKEKWLILWKKVYIDKKEVKFE